MDSSPPNESRRPATSPDIPVLTGNTITGVGMVGIAVVTVLTHGLALPIGIGVSALVTATGLSIPWIPVIRKPKRQKGGDR
jgi:hypothetical protein